MQPTRAGQAKSIGSLRAIAYAILSVIVVVGCLIALYQCSWSTKPAYEVQGTAVGFITQVHSKQNMHVFADVRHEDLQVHRYDTGYAPLDCPSPRVNALLRIRITPRESFIFGKDLSAELIDSPCRPQKS